MKNKKEKWCKARHKIWFSMMQPMFKIVLHKKYSYKVEKYKLDKKQNYLIICNHTCSLDPFMVSRSFNRPVYYVASDDLLKNGFSSAMMKYAVAPIPIKKGTIDFACIKRCINIAKEGGTIGIFPEGNRTYSGEVGYFENTIVKFIRKINLPLIIYHIDGGYGIDPRWGNKPRKGKGSIGKVQRILSPEEMNKLSDDELFELIKSCFNEAITPSLRFKSNNKAEYLERVLFICPKCHSFETIESKGNDVFCKKCSLKVSYGEDLFFKSNDESFKFNKVSDWMNFQKQFLNEYVIEDKTLLHDDNVELIASINNGKKECIEKGKLEMTPTSFIIYGDKKVEFKFSDISSVENQGKHKLLFYIGNDYYQFKGEERFSSYKYYLMFYKINGNLEHTL